MPDHLVAPRPARRAAHAKANLALEVRGRRPDGYHELRSVVVRLSLHDDLEVALVDEAADSLVVDDDADCPVADNLVLRAAAMVRGSAGRPLPGLAFRLRKRVPMGAGLGGGSSDAAAALDLACEAWGVGLDPDEWRRAAAALGADVPFFATDHAAALVEGIGERVRPLPAPDPAAGVLLVTPMPRLATGDVFDAWDTGPSASRVAPAAVDDLAEALASGIHGADLAAMGSALRDANALWPAATALAPALGSLRDDLEATLARPVLMTGSGSTLLALYPSGRAAEDAARTLLAANLASLAGARIVATITQQEGPG